MRGKVISSAMLGAAAAFMLPSSALADDRICRGTLGAITVDNLKVPAGATCKLNRTRVEGNVIVNRKATLRADRIRVDGNVQAEGAALVRVVDSTVGGSIQLEQGRGGAALRNRVEGDIQLFSNRGAFTVTANQVDGNLQCKSNKPRPTGWPQRRRGQQGRPVRSTLSVRH